MFSKKLKAGQERRASYVQSTLREIREKRLSYDASSKGIFPPRTPSRLLSPAGGRKKSALVTTDRPTLSLTKLDFELLREWDWKERQKRLETWGEDLGLTKTHGHFRNSNRDQRQNDNAVLKKGKGHHHHHQGRKSKKEQEDTSTMILKRELQHMTGLRVYAPGDTGHGRRKRSILKHSDHHLPTSGTHSKMSVSISSRRRQSMEGASRIPATQQIRPERLNNLMKEANEVMELKKTFGKGWGGEHREKRKRLSLAPTVQSKRLSRSTGLQSAGTGSGVTTSQKYAHEPPHHRLGSQSHQHHHHLLSDGTSVAPHAHHGGQRHHHDHASGNESRQRTDIEEEQPSTSHVPSSHKSTRTTTPKAFHSRHSSSNSSASGSGGSIGLNDLFRGIRTSLEEDNKSDDGAMAPKSEPPAGNKYQRPPQPVEYQDTCFGGIQFVDRSAVKPMAKTNKGFDFILTLNDPEGGQDEGQQVRVQFFKNKTGHGHGEKALAAKAAEKVRKAHEKEDKNPPAKAPIVTTVPQVTQEPKVITNFSELPATGLIKFAGKNETERMIEFQKALMELPGISSKWHMVVSAPQRKSSVMVTEHGIPARISRRNQFSRPPRRIWYTPLPLTVKKYYRTNWKKIRFDIRKLMKDKEFWPKMWINFEESHPQKLYELIKAKLAVNDFDKFGFERVFDWGRGIHPDYIDWILGDIVPHPGKYYYNVENQERDVRDAEPVRRASVEEDEFHLKEWFVKPPRYIPDTPLSPPFDQFDFCGYGNRDKPFFLAFTLPREIYHHYAPPSRIQQRFVRQIPKPMYSFPGYTFKRWLNYPLEQKIPQYYPFPKRFMAWTRGKIGEPVQCNSTNFYNDDPYIRKRDNTYSPYHDSNTRKYILRRDILDKVWQLGLINSKGEVMCSMAEFNKNRMYLREYEWLEEALRRWDQSWKERQERNQLTKATNFTDLDYEGKMQERQLKLRDCRQLNKIREKEKQTRFKQILEKTRRMMENADRKRELHRQEMMKLAREKQRAQLARRRYLMEVEGTRILNMKNLQEEKSKNAEEHKKVHYLLKCAEKSERQKERWERQAQLHQQQVRLMRRMEIKLENEFRMKVQQRKLKAQWLWRDIPHAIIRKKIRENRSSTIALKWGRIWLEKIRQKRKYLPDFEHVSVWTYAHHLENTVNELKKSSGHIDFTQAMFLFALHKGPQALEVADEENENQIRPKGRRRSSTGEGDQDGGGLDVDEGNDVDYLGSGEDSDEDPERKKSAAAKEEEWDEMNKSDGYEADEDEQDDIS